MARSRAGGRRVNGPDQGIRGYCTGGSPGPPLVVTRFASGQAAPSDSRGCRDLDDEPRPEPGTRQVGEAKSQPMAVALGVDVQVRLGRAPGVADLAQRLPGHHPVALGDADAAGAQVGQLDDARARCRSAPGSRPAARSLSPLRHLVTAVRRRTPRLPRRRGSPPPGRTPRSLEPIRTHACGPSPVAANGDQVEGPSLAGRMDVVVERAEAADHDGPSTGAQGEGQRLRVPVGGRFPQAHDDVHDENHREDDRLPSPSSSRVASPDCRLWSAERRPDQPAEPGRPRRSGARSRCRPGRA